MDPQARWCSGACGPPSWTSRHSSLGYISASAGRWEPPALHRPELASSGAPAIAAGFGARVVTAGDQNELQGQAQKPIYMPVIGARRDRRRFAPRIDRHSGIAGIP